MRNLLNKIDMVLDETTVTGDVAVNREEGEIDLIGKPKKKKKKKSKLTGDLKIGEE